MVDENAAQRDVLWKMYQEHCTQGRHHETQRSTVAGALIAISGAVVGLVTFDRGISSIDLPLTLFLFLLGAFGAVFSAKHYERFSLHMERARRYRDELDGLLQDSPLKRLKAAADSHHNKQFPKLKSLRLNQFWLWLYIFIATLGVVLSVVAVFFPFLGISSN
jgi:hypothetical protein